MKFGFGFDSMINGAGAAYDPDAQVYLDPIGDVPLYAKEAINQRVLDFKTNLGGLSAVGMCYFFPPTRGKFEGWREFISNAINGNQVYTTTNTANPSPLYQFPRATVGINGATFWGGGAYRTGFIPSAELTLNDTAWSAIYQDTDIAGAGYGHGVFNSTTQSMIFMKRSGTNLCFADMYGTNTASGRAQYTGTGASGVYIANRRSTTDFKLYENGVEKDSNATNQGTLPTAGVLINGYGSATTNSVGSDNNLGALCYYKRSLTPTEVAAENTSWQNFATAMKRTGTYLASVIADGDSHFAYYNSAMMREFNAQFWGNAMNIQNIAVSGQAVTNMNTNAATNLFPKIQTGRSDYYLICGGGTNDIAGGASAATTWANMQTYVANAKANALGKGVNLYAIHVPLFNRAYVGEDAKILAQDEYNELVRNNYAVGDYYVDFPDEYSAKRSDYGSDAAFVTAARAFAQDTNYFYDGTHLDETALGYPVIATLIADQVKTILGI